MSLDGEAEQFLDEAFEHATRAVATYEKLARWNRIGLWIMAIAVVMNVTAAIGALLR